MCQSSQGFNPHRDLTVMAWLDWLKAGQPALFDVIGRDGRGWSREML